MSLNKLNTVSKSNEGAWLHLRNPGDGSFLYMEKENGKPDKNKPMRICLYGRDSDTFRNNAMNKARKAIKDQADGVKRDVDLEEAAEQSIEELGLMTKGWENIQLNEGDKALPFTQSNVVSLYKDFPWIKEQVDGFIVNRANFIHG